MESLFLMAFGEEEFLIAFAMACSEAFFNKLLIAVSQHQITSGYRSVQNAIQPAGINS